MKTINRNSVFAVALFLFLWMVQTASAFYSPNLQRWVNRDPIQEKGGINLFSFAGNGPCTRVDDFGRKWVNTGKPVQPGNFGTVVCRNGNVGISLNPTLDFTSRNPAIRCMNQCAAKHEWVHAGEAEKEDPLLCLGVRGITQVKNDDPAADAESEERAWTVELNCLNDCLKKCPGDVNIMAQMDHAMIRRGYFEQAAKDYRDLLRPLRPK